MRAIKPTIKDGQQYWDKPIYAHPKKEFITPMGQSISAAFNNGRPSVPQRIQVGYEREQLRWHRPVFDKNGKFLKLVPRKTQR